MLFEGIGLLAGIRGAAQEGRCWLEAVAKERQVYFGVEIAMMIKLEVDRS